MVGVFAALWGLFGSFAVEGIDLHDSLRRKGQWPWKIDLKTGKPPEVGWPGYLVAEVARLLVGGGLAWAFAATGQIDGPVGAMCAGAAAPLIIGQIAKRIPLELPGELPRPIPRVAVPAGRSDEPEASNGTGMSASAAEVDILDTGEGVDLCVWIPLPDKLLLRCRVGRPPSNRARMNR